MISHAETSITEYHVSSEALVALVQWTKSTVLPPEGRGAGCASTPSAYTGQASLITRLRALNTTSCPLTVVIR